MEISIQALQAQVYQQLRSVSETASLDAQVFIAHFLSKPRSWVLAHPEYLISEEELREIRPALDRLLRGEPLPYIIGHWEFYGLDFYLAPEVLIPRPETELLVEAAISWLQRNPHMRRVVDVGTGSGCIGISIAMHVPEVKLVLADISVPALAVAGKNLEKYGLHDTIEICQSDLLNGIPSFSSFDLICANLPYISTGELDKLPVVKQEPRLALDGGEDGLKWIRRLLKQAKDRLEAGGIILVEIDPSQDDMVIQLAVKYFPSARTVVLKDLFGRNRCVEVETHYMIYHLCPRQDWLGSQRKGEYIATSLESEGFIHCSKRSQIQAVAQRYYKDLPDIVVLAIDPATLISGIRWEKSGEEYYPHVYGPINLEAVQSISDLNFINNRM